MTYAALFEQSYDLHLNLTKLQQELTEAGKTHEAKCVMEIAIQQQCMTEALDKLQGWEAVNGFAKMMTSQFTI